VIELADTSAWWWRNRDPAIAREFGERSTRGEIGTCRQVVLEVLTSARKAAEFDALLHGLNDLRDFPIRRREWDRAGDVMRALLERAPQQHRRVKIADLLVAAAAESAEVPVLHYDRHFELIAEVTGQPMRALAPIGSLG